MSKATLNREHFKTWLTVSEGKSMTIVAGSMAAGRQACMVL